MTTNFICVERHYADQIDLTNETTLTTEIKFKEDADLFMKRLQALV